MNNDPPLLHHVALTVQWQLASEASGYVPGSYAMDGYIHAAWRSQLAAVAERYYRGKNELTLLLIDPNKLIAPLVEENTSDGVEMFPHVYGAVNLDSIIAAHPCVVDTDGVFQPSLIIMLSQL